MMSGIPMTTTTTQFLTAQRSALNDRKASYLADVERLSAAAMELADHTGSQDMADEDGFGEGDTLNVERDQLMVVAAQAQDRIAEIESALSRIDTGSYGVCESCRGPIPEARLEAVPEATRCVSCKSGGILRRK